MDIQWYLMVIFLCIFLMTNNVYYLFMCLLTMCFFFGKVYLQIFERFFLVLTYIVLSCKSSLYVLYILCLTDMLQTFSSYQCLSFYFFNSVFQKQKFLILIKPNLLIFSLYFILLVF